MVTTRSLGRYLDRTSTDKLIEVHLGVTGGRVLGAVHLSRVIFCSVANHLQSLLVLYKTIVPLRLD